MHTHTHTRARTAAPLSAPSVSIPPQTHTHTHMHTHVGCTFLPWLIEMQCACTHMGATRVANGITAHEGSLLTGAIDSATCWHHVMPLSAFGQHGPARPPRGLQTPFWWQMCPHGGPTGRAGPNDGSTTYLWVGRGCPRCHTSCAAVFVAWHTPAKSGRSRYTTNILSLPFLTELLTVAPQTQVLCVPSRSRTGLSPLAWGCLCVAAPASGAVTSKCVWVAQFNVGLFRHRRHPQARLAAAKAARAGRGRERG